jgi:tetratricopeptide (TPR) repeat protein
MNGRLLSVVLLLAACGCGGSSSDKPAESFYDQVAAAQKEPVAELRAKKLALIGYEQARARDISGSERTLIAAAEACRQVDDPSARASALVLLARAHAKLGDSSPARKALEDATAAIRQIEGAESQSKRLAQLAEVQAELNDMPAAGKTLASAEQLAGEIKDVDGNDDLYGRTLALGEVAKSYAKVGVSDEAVRVTDAARAFALAIDDLRNRAEAMAAVAAVQQAIARPKLATETFTSALETARGIEKAYSRAHALADIAERLSEAGYGTQAHKVLDEADLVAHEIPEPDLQRQTVERVRTLMGTLAK